LNRHDDDDRAPYVHTGVSGGGRGNDRPPQTNTEAGSGGRYVGRLPIAHHKDGPADRFLKIKKGDFVISVTTTI
jgi:hypothetical protein